MAHVASYLAYAGSRLDLGQPNDAASWLVVNQQFLTHTRSVQRLRCLAETVARIAANHSMVMMMAQVSTQNKGVEILSGLVQRTGQNHLERRRPKRHEQVSPQSFSVLRDVDKFAAHSETAERLNPALALVVIVSCSATLWSGMVRAATWLAG